MAETIEVSTRGTPIEKTQGKFLFWKASHRPSLETERDSELPSATRNAAVGTREYVGCRWRGLTVWGWVCCGRGSDGWCGGALVLGRPGRGRWFCSGQDMECCCSALRRVGGACGPAEDGGAGKKQVRGGKPCKRGRREGSVFGGAHMHSVHNTCRLWGCGIRVPHVPVPQPWLLCDKVLWPR